ncbi:hypothetical protein CWR43_33935 [Rhizobium sullae]|uniref:Uncharacterized protein n=1 Tax=Rhizobium sullae TaxID=50338 RepID=A0A2N0CZ93_RHISU|nr:hypothetical protein CWR43_33935 [Rhizobium sullae]
MTGISIETLEPWASSLWEARQWIRDLACLLALCPRRSQRTSEDLFEPTVCYFDERGSLISV